ncbi:MAG: endo alpha-1,4 polygalactosaminidase [Hyphomicrobiaceae bacterium]|nr:endo alpha-1,4 polygalactosaminidase [Hyphomicrobiaceae bacterium]
MRRGPGLAIAVLVAAISALPLHAAERRAMRHAGADTNPMGTTNATLERRRMLAGVQSWRYQLRRIEIDEVARSRADLVVIDYAPDRVYGVELPFSAADVRRMQTKPDGSRRLVVAYLSIGEAERYRTYWNNAWYDEPTRPAWLLPPNPRWDGNFPVRFWNPDWQAIILGSPAAYLDRIVAAGFDGVYLDRADVFQELDKENPRAESDMARFIVQLAHHARTLDPNALVILQNAEELMRRAEVREAIDAIAKEDLLHGVEHDARPNPADMVHAALADLRRARNHGLKVLVVEYLDDAKAVARADRRIRAEGFLPLFAERSLGTLDHHGALLPE